MKYPSCYVLTVGNDADVASPNGSPRKSSCMGAAASTVLSPPTSPETGCHGGSGHKKRRKVTSEDQWTTARPPSALNLGSQIVSRSSQDSMICKKCVKFRLKCPLEMTISGVADKLIHSHLRKC